MGMGEEGGGWLLTWVTPHTPDSHLQLLLIHPENVLPSRLENCSAPLPGASGVRVQTPKVFHYLIQRLVPGCLWGHKRAAVQFKWCVMMALLCISAKWVLASAYSMCMCAYACVLQSVVSRLCGWLCSQCVAGKHKARTARGCMPDDLRP